VTGEPILGKNPPEPHRDYRVLTWTRVLRVRTWAQRIADHEDAPVYLVGSALTTRRPRDLDVSIILPHERFVAQFGPIPPSARTVEEERDPAFMPAYMNRLHRYVFNTQPYWKWMIDMGLYIGFTRIDLKICPDSWWPQNDKLLLAAPQGGNHERIRQADV
jgi:hypothetical protein